jgi:flagellar biosynthesis protein FlhF
MKVRKFTAKTSRDALRQVREELGPDAVIMANRMVRGGVEIMAVSAKEMALAAPRTPKIAEPITAPLEMTEEDIVQEGIRASTPANSDALEALANEVKHLSGMLNQSAARQAKLQEQTKKAKKETSLIAQSDITVSEQGASDAVNRSKASVVPAAEEWMKNMMGELRSMRNLIVDQMGAIAINESIRVPAEKSRAAKKLSAAGFSMPLIRKVTTRLPDRVSEQDALNFARSALSSQLKVAGSEAEILDQGGVFAIVGPTGAGKTTTVAKLAARFVVRHGAENLALLTTDGYRIGGQEQLRIYGKILGVAVHAVKDAEDLKRTLAELKNRKLILIDTVGLSQRDQSVLEQLSLFENCGTDVKRLLLLNATSHGDTLNDVVKAYRGKGLAGCIISKLDEAATLGAALDVTIRNSLKLFYATNGQRVPEDLILANAKELVKMAVEMASEDSGYSEWDASLLSQVSAVAQRGVAHA